MIEIEKKAEEIAILKDQIEVLTEQIEKLQGQLEERTYLYNKQGFELIAKIEKMKCCENCKLYDCTVDCKHTKCKYQYSKMCRAENMIDKWELAE